MSPDAVQIRTGLQPGDLGAIIRLHGRLYAQEFGFDTRFEAYVAKPLAEFAVTPEQRQRIWLAENDSGLKACIAIVAQDNDTAQLRWYLVHPVMRGQGLGKRLLDLALVFCRECDYRFVVLWTVSTLEAAAHLYSAVGFRKVETKNSHAWGQDVVEEKYVLDLAED